MAQIPSGSEGFFSWAVAQVALHEAVSLCGMDLHHRLKHEIAELTIAMSDDERGCEIAVTSGATKM